MPAWRKPVSPSIVRSIACQMRSDSTMSGISRGSRPCCLQNPQLRPDCSPAISPFSHNATATPFCARKNAVDVPMMPPPMTTTSTRAGRSESAAMGSIRGAMKHPGGANAVKRQRRNCGLAAIDIADMAALDEPATGLGYDLEAAPVHQAEEDVVLVRRRRQVVRDDAGRGGAGCRR